MEEKLAARRRFFAFNGTLFGIFSLFFAYWLFVKISGIHFPCMFSLLAHLYCPGCGGTRAAEALLRLDVLGSLAANPTVFLGIFVLLYYEIALIRAICRGEDKAPSLRPAAVLLAFFVAYSFLRNILLVTLHFDPLGDHLAYWM